MMYGFIFAAALAAAVFSFAAIGSHPPRDGADTSAWAQANIAKSDRITTGSIPKK